jgi:DNA modification methylase
MKKMPECSVDLTVTSPPYDNLRTYNGNNSQWGDHVWKAVIQDLFRVTKQGGVVVWVVGDATIKGSETGTSFRQSLYFKEIGFNLHDTMIYYRQSPFPSNDRYNQCFEYMFIFSKGKIKTFNPDVRQLKSAKSFSNDVSTKTYRNKNGETARPDEAAIKRLTLAQSSELKTSDNIWYIPTGYMVATKDIDAFNHPAIFPESLARDHIVSWSKEGDTVLDPFMGSGTTGKMSKQLNRNFIGIELDKEYFEIAKKRIYGLHP